MNKVNLSSIDSIMNTAIKQRQIPGGVLLISQFNKVLKHKAYGYKAIYSDDKFTLLNNPLLTEPDTIYDLASVSKVFTSIAILKLIEENLLTLNTPVHYYIPEYKKNGKDVVTIYHLLTHTSGLPSSIPWYRLDEAKTHEEQIAIILSEQLKSNPGKHLYSDLGMIILGIVIENITKMKLNDFIKEIIISPLGMSNTMHQPSKSIKHKIAATEYQSNTNRGLVWGEVHDEKAWFLGGVAGHAGIFSNAVDLNKLCQMILQEGTYNNKSILSVNSIKLLKQNYLRPDDLISYSLGWDLNKRKYMGRLAEYNSIGHRGYTGTSIIISFKLGVSFVLLTNRVHSSRNSIDINYANVLRYEISNVIGEALQ
ncbi:serine hydrolase domain-containing protein [Bacillus sp. FSL W7-1334]|uniref:serine hydrolase domain-containing protein n=1 Tax=Bacillus sp. FSL W7-1334 TaxID=2921703 RepID=UPI0030F9E7D1|nr:serine hydrolase [Bacillus cereus]